MRLRAHTRLHTKHLLLHTHCSHTDARASTILIADSTAIAAAPPRAAPTPRPQPLSRAGADTQGIRPICPVCSVATGHRPNFSFGAAPVENYVDADAYPEVDWSDFYETMTMGVTRVWVPTQRYKYARLTVTLVCPGRANDPKPVRSPARVRPHTAVPRKIENSTHTHRP
jgi:hypothetical protein